MAEDRNFIFFYFQIDEIPHKQIIRVFFSFNDKFN